MRPNLCIFTAFCLIFKGGFCEIEVFAEEGSLAVLPCETPQSRVSPAVKWSTSTGAIWKMQKSGLQFWSKSWASRAKCPHTGFHLGDYSLQIQKVRAEDAGVYSCSVDMDNRRRQLTSINLRVLSVSLSPVSPVLGQSVQVSCRVSRNDWPRGSRVKWTLNGRPYETRDTLRHRGFRDTVSIVKAVHSVSGNWTCVVTSKGREWRASALLEVKGIVQPPEDGSQMFAAVGWAASLPCVFSEGLTPSNTLWERIHTNSTSKPAVGTLPASFCPPEGHVSARDRTAGLREVHFEDEGTFRCSATVGGRRVERSMRLITAKVEVEVLSEKDSSLRLTCKLSDSRNITDYEWIYSPSDLNGTRFIASVHKGRSVSPSPGSEGQWTCRFYGDTGVLGNVSYYIQHKERLLEENSSGGSRDSAVVLVALSLLVLILLLILNQMYRNYQRRKKTLSFPALETIIHNKSVQQEMIKRNQTKQ